MWNVYVKNSGQSPKITNENISANKEQQRHKNLSIRQEFRICSIVRKKKQLGKKKFEVQLGKAKIAENDPTLKFINKIQKILC